MGQSWQVFCAKIVCDIVIGLSCLGDRQPRTLYSFPRISATFSNDNLCDVAGSKTPLCSCLNGEVNCMVFMCVYKGCAAKFHPGWFQPPSQEIEGSCCQSPKPLQPVKMSQKISCVKSPKSDAHVATEQKTGGS